MAVDYADDHTDGSFPYTAGNLLAEARARLAVEEGNDGNAQG